MLASYLGQGDEGSDIPLRHQDLPDHFVFLCFGGLTWVLQLPRDWASDCHAPTSAILHREVHPQELGQFKGTAGRREKSRVFVSCQVASMFISSLYSYPHLIDKKIKA